MNTKLWILATMSLLPLHAFSSEKSPDQDWITQSQAFMPQCEKFQEQVKQIGPETQASQLVSLLETYPGTPEPTLKLRRLFIDGSVNKDDSADLWRAFDCRASVSYLNLIRKLAVLDEANRFSPDIKKRVGSAIINQTAKSATGPTLFLDTLIQRAIIEVAIQNHWIHTKRDISQSLRDLKSQLDETKKQIAAIYGDTRLDDKKNYSELNPSRKKHVREGLLYELTVSEEANEKLHSLLI